MHFRKSYKAFWRRPCGAVVRTEAKRSGDHCTPVSNPTMGHGCQSYRQDRINQGPMSKKVWYKKEPSMLTAMSAEHSSKFPALSPVMVTDTRLLRKCSGDYKQTNQVLCFNKSYSQGIQLVVFHTLYVYISTQWDSPKLYQVSLKPPCILHS
jgi:hypothetical protein